MVDRIVMHDTTDTLKDEVKAWWETNPMLYDWQRTMQLPVGSREFYEEIDRRIWASGPFAHLPDGTLFGRLIEFDKWHGKCVLEIGCGAGAQTAQLARAGANVAALDLTSTATQLTKRRLAVFDLSAIVLQGDAECLPFPTSNFDLVWSWGVIHHTPRTDLAIKEIHRVLKPGGEAHLMVYHRNSIFYWINMMLVRGVLMGGLLRMSPSQLANYYSDGRIAQYFSRREFRDLMGDFVRVHSQLFSQPTEVYPLPRWLKARVIQHIPATITASIGERWGRFLYVQAVK